MHNSERNIKANSRREAVASVGEWGEDNHASAILEQASATRELTDAIDRLARVQAGRLQTLEHKVNALTRGVYLNDSTLPGASQFIARRFGLSSERV